jgi:hypothetical protein
MKKTNLRISKQSAETNKRNRIQAIPKQGRSPYSWRSIYNILP